MMGAAELTLLALLICVALFAGWHFFRRRQAPAKPRGPIAVILTSTEEFELPSVATAASVFVSAGLELVLATRDGREIRPNASSLEQPASKRAADRQDPVWLRVFKMMKAPIRKASLAASMFRA